MDTRVGIQNLISQVAMELLRRVVYIVVVGASTSAFHQGDGNKTQREYDTASIQQPGEFKKEKLT